MDYDALLEQVLALLQREQRLSYRVLKRRLQLDDEMLEDLKEDLIYAKKLAMDERGRVLVWTGRTGTPLAPTVTPSQASQPPAHEADQAAHVTPPSAEPRPPDAERRQLTVLFCDLVDSTALASQLDPEEWREVVRADHETCAKVIARYEGHIAQYLGDGLLVYFGYPQAHEDDARRAVRASLDMLEALGTLNTRWAQDKSRRLAVRIGIHTGLVVVGEMGGGSRHEQLALGDAPNVAARLQGLAHPDTVVISAATHRLVQGYFTVEPLGPQPLKGVAAPVPRYRILGTSTGQSRLDVAEAAGWTPLVGRESEVALFLERWAHGQEGRGQVVLLSGEAGIGKSRLMEVLRERVVSESGRSLVFRCSPYHTQSALHPIIEHLRRVLDWGRDETSAATLSRLETMVAAANLPLHETMPLLATLLSVPLPKGRYPPLVLTPQQQRQRTLDALVTWLLAAAERQPVLVVWEDLHWADPSTLELLGLLIEQVPTARMLTLGTARPEFRPLWAPRTHLTQLTLGRLPRAQVETMVRQLTGDKPLPAGVLAQVVAKTDGVPLFVEELVKMLLESGLLREEGDHYELTGPLPPLAIPATLQDSLMARLDRLSTARTVAQLGSVLGREFPYALVRAVAPLDEATVQRGLAQLVDAELLYQRGRPPQARYVFKHALIQETGYQSLLKSTRQHYHQRSAQVLAAQFPEIVETQPELVAWHYTEAGLTEQAIPHWLRAGQQALQRSANTEAVQHLTTGLALLAMLPETPARARQELDLQLALGPALMAVKGFAAPETAGLYYRRREPRTVQVQAEALLSLATAQGFPSWVGYGTFWRGWALSMQGQEKAGLVQMNQGLAALLATGQMNMRLLCLVLMAEAMGQAGQVAEGLRLLTEVLTAFEASARRDMVTEAYRLQGELLLRQVAPGVAQAEASFQQALDIARRQQAKSWELRASMSLSRLWQQQGRRAEGRELLAPIYGWFTEGFDTADLQEAKALLDELA